MTENDYIAEYIKEKYASLLGFDFAVWKTMYVIRIAAKAVTDIVKTVNPEDLKKLMESKNAETDGEIEEDGNPDVVNEQMDWHEMGR